MNNGWTGIEKDYPVSVQDVINITAETGALTAQSRIRELKPYKLPKRKTGNWDITIDKRGLKCAICSSCGMIMYAGTTKFCPECGADMRNNHNTN